MVLAHLCALMDIDIGIEVRTARSTRPVHRAAAERQDKVRQKTRDVVFDTVRYVISHNQKLRL
eukprot:scaffold10803_cov133-Isochrysis_galbana.AAC.5